MGTVAEQQDDGQRAERRAEVVGALGERLAPVTMAHERTLPVAAEFAGLFVEGALVRGRVLSSAGSAATSVAMALLAPAIEAGGWLAVVDVPTIGLDAASELGICLERVVGIDLGDQPAAVWPDVIAAAADGFELMLTRVPAGVRPSAARSVMTRLQRRGVVVVVLGDPGALSCDVVIESSDRAWEGLGDGFGHLRRRTVQVVASGRRIPAERRATVSFQCPTTARGPLVGIPASDSVAAPELVLAV